MVPASDTPAFQPLPNRDAWATIRGFVYQVDVTLLRWLDLDEDAELALECGEDVDRIGPALDAGETLERLLEQIKYREHNLTLRSPEALEAISSFQVQRDFNPETVLRFRFLTNAAPGREAAPTPLPGTSAIRLWSDLARADEPTEETATILQGIRTLLTTASRPESTRKDHWHTLQRFLERCSADQLLRFVRAFEWGMEAGDINQVQAEVRSKLVLRGRSAHGDNVQRAHAQLFVHVLRVLARPGPKRLAMADLDQALSPEELAGIAESTLRRIDEVRGVLLSRLDDIERAVRDLKPAADEGLRVGREILQVSLKTQDSVRQILAERQTIQGAAQIELAAFARLLGSSVGTGDTAMSVGVSDPIDTEPPPLVSMASERPETVANLLSHSAGRSWCAIYGISGTGKTQLARLTVARLGGSCVWLRLRDLSSSDAVRRIKTVLNSIALKHPAEAAEIWLTRVCRSLGAHAIVVLDDLPITDPAGTLAELLARLSSICQQVGTQLLSTAGTPLASSTRSLVYERLHEESVPLLLDAEVAEIFRNYGAPDEFVTASFLKLVTAVSNRHPVLVVEAARYLQSEGWQSGSKTIDAFIYGSYATGLATGTIEGVRRTIRDEEARELLYRLKLIGSPFGTDQVQVVSDVTPTITRPMDRFGDLVGLWVQRDTARQFTVSPLITSLMVANLPKARQHLVHWALANELVSKRRLGPEEAHRAILHFAAAERYDNAASILLLALNGLAQQAHPADYLGITALWADLPLPSSIDRVLKLLIRTLQAVVLHRLGKSPSYPLGDLDRLLAERDPEPGYAFVTGGIAGMVASILGKSDPVRATDYLIRGIRALRTGDFPVRIADDRSVGDELLAELWMIGAWITDDDHLEHWLTTVRELSPEELRRWAGLSYAYKGSELVCTGIWMRAAEASPASRDWVAVFDNLDHLRTWAIGNGVTPLAVHSLRAQIIVKAEYENDLNGAVLLAEEALSMPGIAPDLQFWISEITARQYYYQHRPVEALTWFERAFVAESGVGAAQRVSALVVAAGAAATLSAVVSNAYLARAITLVESTKSDELSSILVTQTWGEFGIAQWVAGDRSGAYRAWKHAVELLLSVEPDSDERKILFQVMGNCTGYFALMTEVTDTSSWPYAVPEPGILLKMARAVLPLYRPGGDSQILAQMMLFAEGVGAYDDVVEWASRLAGSDGRGLPAGMETLVQQYWAPRLLGEGRLTEVVARARAAVQPFSESELAIHSLPDMTAQGAELYRKKAGHLNIVAVVIELARRWLRSQGAAYDLASKVAEECRVTGHPETSSWWATAGAAVTDAFSPGGQWRVLYERGAAVMDSDAHLGMIYYFGAMLWAAPKEALGMQMAVLMWLRSMFSKTLFHFTVCQLLPEYWGWATAQYPAHFGNPRLARSYLIELGSLQGEDRLRATLRAMAESLGVPPGSPEVSQWLLGATSIPGRHPADLK